MQDCRVEQAQHSAAREQGGPAFPQPAVPTSSESWFWELIFFFFINFHPGTPMT